MRKILYVLLFSTSLLFSKEINTTSKITEAVVYLSGAEITREAYLSLNSGSNDITLTGLSPNINSSTIQIRGLKSASVLAINYDINYMVVAEKSEKEKSLNELLEAQKKSKNELINLITGLDEELKVLNTNRNLSSEQKGLSLAKIQEISDYYRRRTISIKNEIYDANASIKKIEEKLTKIQNELNKVLENNKEKRGEIKLKLNSEEELDLKLIISYNVNGAGWFPVYDVKSESTKAPLTFHYKAHVYQNTSQDWSNVKLTLSTGDPSVDNTMPIIESHNLNFVNPINYNKNSTKNRFNYKYNPMVNNIVGYVYDEEGQPLPGVNVLIKGTSTGVSTDFDGKYIINNVMGAKELEYSYVGMQSQTLPIYSTRMNVHLEYSENRLDEVVVAGYAKANSRKKEIIEQVQEEQPVTKHENVTTTVFKISKKYNIPSINDVTVIEIDSFTINADYTYFAAPVINENVYLLAKITDWEQYNLLPGEANVYFEGNYAGKTYIDPNSIEEKLNVSLGIDPSVVVERNEARYNKNKSFIGNSRIVDKAFEILVKNNKNYGIELILKDRIPLSQNNQIKVNDIEFDEGDYNTKTQIIEWKITLNSKEQSKKHLSYELRYPKGKYINL
ncbi:DUF4139 domain-containing protein [Zhouia amylolytica]|uniref:Mucoidy inhibitor MuiA family protein n=1 Tax=Zhouia amylolytica AD3 TaxID=1286632 RepID=W2UMR1_9FLAO|nr:DUF4139 domain-containing protein [Zhouia amylolytica]ETN95450.1 hypothetical protein P278_11720 [Zhouia amylolytica AD3]